MNLIETAAPGLQYRKILMELWNNEYPVSLTYKTTEQFDNYLSGLQDPQHFLMTDEQGSLQAWAFTFTREEEKWFAIILREHLHGKGIGRQLIQQLQSREHTLNGWVIDRGAPIKNNGQPYRYPIGFYLKCGFEILSEVRLELPHFSAVKIRWHRQSL